MPVRTSTDYKAFKTWWTIYRVDLDSFEARVFREINDTEENVDRELKKIRKFVKKNDHPSAYIKRREERQSSLVIPVFGHDG